MPNHTDSVPPLSPTLPPIPRVAGNLSYESQESVCGDDGRQLVIDTQKPPYYWLCRLSIHMQSGGYVGSGFLISTGSPTWDVILTSGHCVHAQHEGFAESVVVVPGATQTSHPFGTYKVGPSNLRASEKWKAHGADKANYDYGVILLPKTHTLPAIGLWVADDNELGGKTIMNAGYPADKNPYGNLWEMTGPLTTAGERMLYYMNDTAGGQSGSPAMTLTEGTDWSDTSKIRAVGIHGYGGCPNKAVRITREVFSQVMEWSNSQGTE